MLEVGKVADICVVGGDVLDTDPHELIDLPITITVLGGTVVYRRDGNTAATPLKAASTHLARGTACLAGGNCCCRPSPA
jgi:hypothetical protein